jgi:hypothetical protein
MNYNQVWTRIEALLYTRALSVNEVGAAGGAAALGLVGQSLDHAVVGGVLGEVLKPQQRGALALENEGNPAERVIKVPDGDADAAADLDAGTDNLGPLAR